MSQTPVQVWRIVATGALFVAWAIAAHLGSAGVGSAGFNAGVAVLPLFVALGALLWQARSLAVLLGGLAMALAAVVWAWPQLRDNVPGLYYLQHLGSHLALGVLFGKTLWGPGDALITGMARHIFGNGISERKVRYTRQVTAAWAVYFFANALVSTGLFLWAPLEVWSIHANLLTGPLIALMFLGEHLVRKRMLPVHERPSIVSVVRAYRQRTGQAASSEPASRP